MADITDSSSGRKRSVSSKPRSKKLVPKVDMTPMVDLGFLLISFFMLTIVMADDREILLVQPQKDVKPAEVDRCQVLSILIDSTDKVYTYEGDDMKTFKESSFNPTNGIRQAIMAKARRVKNECALTSKGEKRQLVCLIKPLPGAHYQKLISVLDEMDITKTNVYAIQDPLPEEIAEVSVKQKEFLAENKK